MNRCVCVTGAGGYIGSALAKTLAAFPRWFEQYQILDSGSVCASAPGGNLFLFAPIAPLMALNRCERELAACKTANEIEIAFEEID